MDMKKSKMISQWFSNFAVSYNEFRKESKSYRCKIVNVDTNKDSNLVTLFVMINGIKKQVIPYFPKELVLNDAMLDEFSSFDVRAITFYALQEEKNKVTEIIPDFMIDGQEFLQGKTIFIIKKTGENFEERRSAHELYCDMTLLNKFSCNDLKNIISTAIHEQAINDFKNDQE